MGNSKTKMPNPLKLIGLLLFCTPFVLYGWDLHTKDSVKADAHRRVLVLWNLGMQHYSFLVDYNTLFTSNAQYVILAMMYCLLGVPLIILCRWLAVFPIMAWALYCSLFFNPWITYKDLYDNDVPATNNYNALRVLALMGGLIWKLGENPSTVRNVKPK